MEYLPLAILDQYILLRESKEVNSVMAMPKIWLVKMWFKRKKMQRLFSQKHCGMNYIFRLFGMVENIHQHEVGILKKTSLPKILEEKLFWKNIIKKHPDNYRDVSLISNAFEVHVSNFNNTQCS